MIEADRRPGILARMLGPALRKAREVVGLSYDEAAAWLGCEADWLIRVETGLMVATPEDVARTSWWATGCARQGPPAR